MTGAGRALLGLILAVAAVASRIVGAVFGGG